jgi:flagellar biosynthesis protein FlhF
VIAKDSRRATEQVIATYGPDALIISNQRVNGMTEIVVAIETENSGKDAATDTPTAAPAIATRNGKRTDAFGRTLLSSLDGDRGSAKSSMPRESSEGKPNRAARAEQSSEPRHVPPFLRGTPVPAESSHRKAEAVEPTDDDIAPEDSVSRRDDITESVETRPAASEAPRLSAIRGAAAPGRSLHEELPDPESQALDTQRARELVDLVRAELVSMRQEIALSRHVDVFPPGGTLPAELQPLAGALASAGVPVALRMLLLDQARDCQDLESAADSMKLHLAASMGSLERSDRFEGIHVFAGPSGAGKSQMLFRLAARHIALHGAGSVAVLSFADARIGAWTQIQMLAARLGVDCYRVTGEELLGPMIEELQPRRLILIDTAGTGFGERLAAIQRCAPKACFNLVVPGDVSASSLARFIPGTDIAWHSVMVSKLDEPTHLWPLIQALCNHAIPLSLSSAGSAAESTASVVSPADLVRIAFEGLELPIKPAPRARAPKKSAPRVRREERHAA